MKASDMRALSDSELEKKRVELTEEIFNLRIQISTQQTTNVTRIRTLKRELARLLTIKKEKELTTGRS
mgnify:FL=1